MLICMKCKTQLLQSKSSTAAETPNGIFPGNLHTCPICSIKLLLCKDYTTPDIHHRLCDTYVDVGMGVPASKIDLSGEEK